MFYMSELDMLRQEGLVTVVDHAQFMSEFCLEYQSNLQPDLFKDLEVDDRRGGRVQVPLLLQQVYAAAAPLHSSGNVGLSLFHQQFGQLATSTHTFTTRFQLLGSLLLVAMVVLAMYFVLRRPPSLEIALPHHQQNLQAVHEWSARKRGKLAKNKRA